MGLESQGQRLVIASRLAELTKAEERHLSSSPDQGFTLIRYERDERGFATITLNRPDSLNAISIEVLREINAALAMVERDERIKVAIIKGEGRAFSAGHDLSDWGKQYGMEPGVRAGQGARAMSDRDFFWTEYSRLFFTLKPKIAQVHGYCLEGAMCLSMMCDITIAADDAKLGFPGQRAGDAGMTLQPMLFNLIGYKRAREMVLTGEVIDGIKAAEIGLVNRAVPAAELDDVVTRMATAIGLLPVDGIVMGHAATHMIYDRLGFTSAFMQLAYGHAWWTNIHYGPDDFNLLRERKNRGLREALHARDARYDGLLDENMGGYLGQQQMTSRRQNVSDDDR
jgi:enoyl-CoA hydratase